MTLGILHLSDVHIKKELDNNPVLDKSQMLVRAISAIPENLSHLLVVISGDLAYSGHASEYQHVASFLLDLHTALRTHTLPFTYLALIPGNHDCNFEDSSDIRRIILESPQRTFTDSSPLKACLAVQKGYRKFITSLAAQLPDTTLIALKDVATTETIDCGEHQVCLTLLNTAWCSEQRERQGTLTFPKAFLETLDSPPNSTLAITALHHPFNWLKEMDARALRRELEKRSDIILTGHEHESEFYRRESRPEASIEYFEGGVLQDSNDRNNSTFNLIVVAFHEQQFRVQTHRWNQEARAYHVINDYAYQSFRRNINRLGGAFPFTSEFEKRRTDVGVGFRHPRRQQLRLDDIYVFPDFRDVKQDESGDEPIPISKVEFLRCISANKHILIVGGDTSGKTSLAKQLISELRSEGTVPVFLRATDIDSARDTSLHKSCTVAADAMYGKSQTEAFWQLSPRQRVVIVDDFHRCCLGPQERCEALTWLSSRFDKVVVLGGEELRFDELHGECDGLVTLWDFRHFEILELGFQRRSQLIAKWHSLGLATGTVEGELQRRQAETEKVVNSFLGEQLMPAHPIIVLIVLQQLEAKEPIATTGNSAGYLYTVLIYRSLTESVTASTDIDTNENYLAELAYVLLRSRRVRMSVNELRAWHGTYCSNYHLSLSLEQHLQALKDAGLLEDESGQIGFKYPYLYYYFVATYLTRHMSATEPKTVVENLCTYLHQEEAANIILFVCHLSRSEMVIDLVLETAGALFAGYAECDFEDDVAYINDIVGFGEDPKIAEGTPEQRRQKALEEADNARRKRQACGEANRTELLPVEYERKCELDKLNDSLQLNAALKTIQIIGQILRNHVGSIPGAQKKRLAKASFSLGLRASKCMFGLVEENIDDLVESLVGALERRQGAIPRTDLLRSVKRSVWGTLRLGAFSIVRYISDSVGMERMAQSFEEILIEERKLPLQIIDLSIKLDHFRAFPENEAIGLAAKLRKNPFAYGVVRDLVYMRFYLYQVDYRIRQRVSEKLRISVEGQKRIVQAQGKKSRRRGGGRPQR